MAAAMSTADGLILAIANALSHDVYFNMIDPKADVRKKRLIVARVLLVVIGAAGAYIASMRITGILGAVAWAFDFAMSGLFFLYLEYGGRELQKRRNSRNASRSCSWNSLL